MYKDINELLGDIRELQEQMESLFDNARTRFHYTLEGRRVLFSREVENFQRRFRIGSLHYIFTARLLSLLTAPVIYGMLVPLLVFDLGLTLYQHICFRAYRVARVSRRDYLVIDRHKLVYLNAIEKMNCVYCSYSSGLIAYAREIHSRTEQYWCPIREAHRLKSSHPRYPYFFDYGDAEAWKADLGEMRRKLQPPADRDKPAA